jgi:hypothetical protein
MKPFLGYIDPGTGLLLWQAIVSIFVGLLFYVKKSRDWLFASLRRLLRIHKPHQDASSSMRPEAVHIQAPGPKEER